MIQDVSAEVFMDYQTAGCYSKAGIVLRLNLHFRVYADPSRSDWKPSFKGSPARGAAIQRSVGKHWYLYPACRLYILSASMPTRPLIGFGYQLVLKDLLTAMSLKCAAQKYITSGNDPVPGNITWGVTSEPFWLYTWESVPPTALSFEQRFTWQSRASYYHLN